MVILAAAALGAAGYGAYKGGEAAVQKGRDMATEHQRNKKRQEHASDLKEKTASRRERINQLNSLRQSGPSSSSTVSSDSQRQNDVIASFRARHDSSKASVLRGLLKRGPK